MAFVHIVDTDRNEHYVRLNSIVNVRTTMSGGAFVDVAGLESPIFVQKSARETIEMILNSDVLERPMGGG
jgi:hypothetical protein